MVLGGSLEADRRIRTYERRMRLEKRIRRDKAVWEEYEDEFRRVEESGKEK